MGRRKLFADIAAAGLVLALLPGRIIITATDRAVNGATALVTGLNNA